MIEEDLKQNLVKIAKTIRNLAIDGVEKAQSGHPGMPLGCAELGAYLYGHFLLHNPSSPDWIGRDRLILSCGHGSMWLYSCLHLAGFPLTLEDLQHFRQLHSKTPGHPEKSIHDGIETTTGPLGQGIANGCGQAIALKQLAARFNRPSFPLFSQKVICIGGDGCFMEGINHESASLAGHLQLDNLILIYDYNEITLDGPLKDSCSEDVKARYLAYGWDVFEIDGHDLDEIHAVLTPLRKEQKRPTLIIAHTIIGKGSPNKAGSFKVHGSPLGAEEAIATKHALYLPEEPFHIPRSVKNFFEKKQEKQQQLEEHWQQLFAQWKELHPNLHKIWQKMESPPLREEIEQLFATIQDSAQLSGRKASSICLNLLAEHFPQIIGGSADLSCSDSTFLNKELLFSSSYPLGRNIKYGVREFAMAAMATGIAQSTLLLPYVGTFLTFSDYMRNAIRLAALMGEKVVYQFTHDSIFLGEDGPTHQPIEHLASLRAIPRLVTLRPCDLHEVKGAWIAALEEPGPCAIILSRQNCRTLKESDQPFEKAVGRGAYLLRGDVRKADYTLFATGSEVALAMDVAEALEKIGKSIRVISMPSWELFERQKASYRSQLLSREGGKRIAIEAGCEMGWHKYVGADGMVIAMEGFGASAPQSALAKEFGFTVEAILDRILAWFTQES